MFDHVTLHAMETVLSFSVFVGILLWAYSARRKAAFDQLALLPFDDEAPAASAAKPDPESSPTSAEPGHV